MQTRGKKPAAGSEKTRKLMKADNPSQYAAFIEKARELGCDENESAFEERLCEIAKSPPQPAKKDKDKAPE